MALPPKQYAGQNGRRCGEDYYSSLWVTGKIEGVDFGRQFEHRIDPISRKMPEQIANDRAEQVAIENGIRGSVRRIRKQIAEAKYFTGTQRKSIDWLLRRAERYVERAEELWDKWEDRPGGAWPLTGGDFFGGVCTIGEGGTWKSWKIGRGTMQVLCPDYNERLEHERDRKRVGKLLADALAHVHCADAKYWRVRLYTQAAEAYLDILEDQPDIGVSPTPGLQIPGGFVSPTKPVDPCADLGVGCPPGDEPEGCPSGFCVDPESLPDPTDVPIDPETRPGSGLGSGLGDWTGAAQQRARTGKTLVLLGAGALLLTGVVAFVAR